MRILKATKRQRRITRLWKSCKEARKLYTSGALPGLSYGAEVTGANAEMLKRPEVLLPPSGDIRGYVETSLVLSTHSGTPCRVWLAWHLAGMLRSGGERWTLPIKMVVCSSQGFWPQPVGQQRRGSTKVSSRVARSGLCWVSYNGQAGQ